jgi:predicted DNA-binding WGR domain protein
MPSSHSHDPNEEYTELFRAGVWHELVFKSDEADKFWSIKIVKTTHVRRWGASGTEGREMITEFDSVDEARENAEKLYLSKTKGGYVVAKPTLAYDTDLCHFVEHDELERFIEQVYGTEFNFRQDVDSREMTFRYRPSGELSDDEEEDIIQWVRTGVNEGYMTHSLLDDCVRQRLIPAGTYVIEVL